MGTAIAWTNETWNPVTGCSHVSAGCDHCYAETLSLKKGWSTAPWTIANEAQNVILHPDRLSRVRAFKPGSRIFVNSMSDLFHRQVPDSFIAEVFAAMATRPDCIFQILTKRPARAATWPGPWLPHIWMGTSVEDQRVIRRIHFLRQCGAAVRFLSCEPLIGPLDLTGETDGLHWVIVGGESGPGFRPMDHAWGRAIRDVCVADGVAFFFKQSAAWRTELGTALQEEDGSRWIYQQYPGALTPPTCIAPAPHRQPVLLTA